MPTHAAAILRDRERELSLTLFSGFDESYDLYGGEAVPGEGSQSPVHPVWQSAWCSLTAQSCPLQPFLTKLESDLVKHVQYSFFQDNIDLCLI